MTEFLEISISENYPFFIWECEGNGVYYTIQILLKLFAFSFNKTYLVSMEDLTMFQNTKSLKIFAHKGFKAFDILDAFTKNIFEKNF